MSEREINIHIQRVLAGDTSAFSPLVDHYKNLVYTVCFRILNHRENAEDAAQNTFIKAYNNLETFNGKAKFSTWLYTIAFRTSVSMSRLKVNEMVHEEFFIDQKSAAWSDHHDVLEVKDKEAYVQKAIETLPEIDQVIVTLYYLDDCSIQEISTITDITPANIKIRLFRARKQLKASLRTLLNEELELMRR